MAIASSVLAPTLALRICWMQTRTRGSHLLFAPQSSSSSIWPTWATLPPRLVLLFRTDATELSRRPADNILLMEKQSGRRTTSSYIFCVREKGIMVGGHTALDLFLQKCWIVEWQSTRDKIRPFKKLKIVFSFLSFAFQTTCNSLVFTANPLCVHDCQVRLISFSCF